MTDTNAPRRLPVLAAERRRLMLQAVRSGERAQVADLAESFGVSQMTVRRDLAHLARQGKLTRVHGGAVSEGGGAAVRGNRGGAPGSEGTRRTRPRHAWFTPA